MKMEEVVIIVLQDIIQMKVNGNVKNVNLELIHTQDILLALIVKLDSIVMKIKVIAIHVHQVIIQMKVLLNVQDVRMVIIQALTDHLNVKFVQQVTL